MSLKLRCSKCLCVIENDKHEGEQKVIGLQALDKVLKDTLSLLMEIATEKPAFEKEIAFLKGEAFLISLEASTKLQYLVPDRSLSNFSFFYL